MISARHSLVLGAGKSGLAATRLLRHLGSEVIVADQRPPNELVHEKEQVEAWGGSIHFGENQLPWGPFDLCVVSPGFDFESNWVQAAYALSAMVLSELELGWSCLQARTLAITGSNGKSTAVKWATEAIQAAGFTSVAAGNYGRPACDVCMASPTPDWLVLEVSSFQFETVHAFAPEAGIVLNLHPNHLDRHANLDQYADLKARCFSQMDTKSTAICPARDLNDWQQRAGRQRAAWGAHRFAASPGLDSEPNWIGFAVAPSDGNDELHADYLWKAGAVYKGAKPVADFQGTPFGESRLATTAVAVTAAFDQLSLPVEHLVTAARAFTPLPHRMETVGERDGVVYINDSKSTNSGSLMHAIQSISEPIRLIAGGVPKESTYRNLKQLLTERVQKVYLIGIAKKQMLADWAEAVECVSCDTLETALQQVDADVKAGEVVLFSPGCASFDQYRSYEERGKHFTRLIHA